MLEPRTFAWPAQLWLVVYDGSRLTCGMMFVEVYAISGCYNCNNYMQSIVSRQLNQCFWLLYMSNNYGPPLQILPLPNMAPNCYTEVVELIRNVVKLYRLTCEMMFVELVAISSYCNWNSCKQNIVYHQINESFAVSNYGLPLLLVSWKAENDCGTWQYGARSITRKL